jgi:hypothetical protein
MRLPQVRFTIRGLMIAVAILAGLLALPDGLREVAAALSPLSCLALFTAWRLLSRGYRRLAGACFWGLAIVANVLLAAFCVVPKFESLVVLFLVWLFILLPTIAGLGSAWAILATREVAATRRVSGLAWLSVVVLSVMPGVTVWTGWPLHLAFLMARPALERLADEVAAGQAIPSPRWVGPFRVAGSAVDRATGNVGLMIDPNPNHPIGFIRDRNCRTRSYCTCVEPIRGDVLHLVLGDEWSYREED